MWKSGLHQSVPLTLATWLLCLNMSCKKQSTKCSVSHIAATSWRPSAMPFLPSKPLKMPNFAGGLIWLSNDDCASAAPLVKRVLEELEKHGFPLTSSNKTLVQESQSSFLVGFRRSGFWRFTDILPSVYLDCTEDCKSVRVLLERSLNLNIATYSLPGCADEINSEFKTPNPSTEYPLQIVSTVWAILYLLEMTALGRTGVTWRR